MIRDTPLSPPLLIQRIMLDYPSKIKSKLLLICDVKADVKLHFLDREATVYMFNAIDDKPNSIV